MKGKEPLCIIISADVSLSIYQLLALWIARWASIPFDWGSNLARQKNSPEWLFLLWFKDLSWSIPSMCYYYYLQKFLFKKNKTIFGQKGLRSGIIWSRTEHHVGWQIRLVGTSSWYLPVIQWKGGECILWLWIARPAITLIVPTFESHSILTRRTVEYKAIYLHYIK